MPLEMKMEDAQKTKREDVCPSKRLDRATVEAQLRQTTGPEYWRSLEELAGTAEFQEMLHREFPKGASEWVDSVSRRGFLQLMGASLAMAGMTGCTKLPLEPIVPYVRQPEEVIPGRPMFYATAVTLSGYASPVLVESHLGRPTKIEGNDKHPASLGGTDIFTQAAILGMYDPDRSQTITYRGDVNSWSEFVKEIKGPLAVQKGLGGAGIRILTQTISSPTLADQLKAFLKIYPQAKWHVYEPVNRDNVLRRRETGVRAAGRDALRLLESRRHRLAGRGFSVRGLPGNYALHSRLCQPAQSRWADEPVLRDREHANVDGGEGGSSAAGAGEWMWSMLARALSGAVGVGASGSASHRRGREVPARVSSRSSESSRVLACYCRRASASSGTCACARHQPAAGQRR